MKKITKINGIIHTSSAAAGVVGASTAQTVVADKVALAAIQIPMIIAIAEICGKQIDKASAIAFMAQKFTQNVGMYAASRFVVWIPGWGNTINAGVATSMTEALGWTTYHYYNDDEK